MNEVDNFMDEGQTGSSGLVVPADRVRFSDVAVPIGAPCPGGSRGEPKIQLVREGGVIRAIEVICACGQLIRVRCDYS
jgi:hypothetical protein